MSACDIVRTLLREFGAGLTYEQACNHLADTGLPLSADEFALLRQEHLDALPPKSYGRAGPGRPKKGGPPKKAGPYRGGPKRPLPEGKEDQIRRLAAEVGQSEAARRLGLSRSYVCRVVHRGRALPGRRPRFTPAQAEKYRRQIEEGPRGTLVRLARELGVSHGVMHRISVGEYCPRRQEGGAS